MKSENSRRRFFGDAGIAAAAAGLAGLVGASPAAADAGISAKGFINAVKRARIFDLSHT